MYEIIYCKKYNKSMAQKRKKIAEKKLCELEKLVLFASI